MSVVTSEALRASRPKFKDVEVADLGTVRIKAINQFEYYDLVKQASDVANSGETTEALNDALTHARMLRDLYPTLIAMACIDEDGSPVFTGPSDPDIGLLRPNELAAIGNAAYEFWGFDALVSASAQLKN